MVVTDVLWGLLMPNLIHHALDKNKKLEMDDITWKSEEVSGHCVNEGYTSCQTNLTLSPTREPSLR